MTDAAIFARITKSTEQADGSLIVRGTATDGSLDADAQRCDPEWLKSAMPDWFRYGNIREQHSHIAAGVATEYTVEDGDRHVIEARIVDPGSVAKIRAGVLKGFSIGIRNAQIRADKSAPGGIIQNGQIVEVSVVDRPSNGSCTLTLAKAMKPGMPVATGAFDPATNLVKVEEYREVETADKVAEADVLKSVTAEDVVTVPDSPAALVEAAPEPAPVAPAEVAPVAAEAGSDSGAPAADADAAGEGGGSDGAGAPGDTAEPEGVPVLIGEPGPEVALPTSVRPGEAVLSPADEFARRAALAAVVTPPVEAVPVPEVAPVVDAPVAPVEPSEKAVTADAPSLDMDALAAKVADILKAAGAVPAAPAPAPKALAVSTLKGAGIGDVAAAAAHLASRGVTVQMTALDKAEGMVTHDVETLRQVRNGLLSLIIAEATEALGGDDETCDMRMLLDSLSIFQSWWQRETLHGEAPPSTQVSAVDPVIDAVKSAGCGCCDACTHDTPEAAVKATAPDAGDAASTQTPEATDGSGSGDSTTHKTATPDTVKAAVAEAVTVALQIARAEAQEEIDALKARLATVEKAAAPGGPARRAARIGLPPEKAAELVALEYRREDLWKTARGLEGSDRAVSAEFDKRVAELDRQIAVMKAASGA